MILWEIRKTRKDKSEGPIPAHEKKTTQKDVMKGYMHVLVACVSLLVDPHGLPPHRHPSHPYRLPDATIHVEERRGEESVNAVDDIKYIDLRSDQSIASYSSHPLCRGRVGDGAHVPVNFVPSGKALPDATTHLLAGMGVAVKPQRP